MRIALILIIVVSFCLGITATVLYASYNSGTKEFPLSYSTNTPKEGPYDRIKESQIKVTDSGVSINVQNAEWASFTPTHSMDPVLSDTAHAIQVVPKSQSEIHVGDIISYSSSFVDGTVIHRVINISSDKRGWYCLAQGDNNPTQDPEKIRFSQIKRVLVAIIY